MIYEGCLALRAVRAEERLIPAPGRRGGEVVDHVAARCGLDPAGRRHLLVSVSNTGGGEELADGDRITVAILAGGK